MPHKSHERYKEYQRWYQRYWRKKYPDKIKIIRRKWYRGHREERLAQTVIANRRRYHKFKILALEKYGGIPAKCACCGETQYEFLTIDHINGGGSKHRKSLNRYTGGLYGWLVKTRKKPAQFRVLCLNCNCAVFRYGICPHQRES